MKYKNKKLLVNFIMLNIFYVVTILILSIKLTMSQQTLSTCNVLINECNIELDNVINNQRSKIC